MNLPRSVPGTAAGLLALALAASLAVGAAVAEEDPPPPPPPAYYGSILVDGDPAPEVGAVTAFVDGEQRGCLTPDQAGSYGGPGGFDPKLAVDGTSEDEGKAVAFRVNGVEATPDPAVTWASSDVREVNLSVPEVGEFVACSRTSTVDEETVRAEGENAQAGSNVTMDLPSTQAGEDAGVELTGLEVQLEEDLDEFQVEVRHSPDPVDGTPSPDLQDGADPLVFVEVTHDFPDGSLSEVTFTFRVSHGRLDEAGLTPDEVRLHRYAGGSWSSLPSTHLPDRDTDTHRLFEATSPGFSVFAVGPPEATSGGGGGGGGGTTGDALTVEAGEVFDLDAGQPLEVTGLPAGFTGLSLELSEACQACSVNLTTHPSPPAGMDAVPDGFAPLQYLSLEVRRNGSYAPGLVADGQLTFTVDAQELPPDASPDQALLLHHEDGAWNPLATERTSAPGEDPSTHAAELTSFSAFATAADEEPPRIYDLLPEDGILVDVHRPTIQASWEDDRGVDLDTFTLTLDGELHVGPNTSEGDDRVRAQGFSYTPDEPLPEEDVTATVTVQDESGLEAQASWSFKVVEPTCDTPPRIVERSPADGAVTDEPRPQVRIAYEPGGPQPECDIYVEGVTLRIDGEPVPVEASPGEATWTPQTDLDEGAVQVEAKVPDQERVTQTTTWSFVVETESADAGDEAPPEGEDGLFGFGDDSLTGLLAAAAVTVAVLAGAVAYVRWRRDES